MQRTFALVGFSFLLAQLAALVLGADFALPLLIFLSLLTIPCICIKKVRKDRTIAISLVTALIAVCLHNAAQYVAIKPVEKLEGQEAEISGIITQLPQKSNNTFYYIIKTDSIDFSDVPQSVTVKVSSYTAFAADVFDRITLNVRFYPARERTPFSTAMSYQAKGIQILAYSLDFNPKIETSDTKPMTAYPLFVRQKLLSAIRKMLPPRQAEVVNGVFLGDTSGIDSEITEAFRAVGLSHLLAVSGLHLVLLSTYLISFFVFIGIGKRTSSFICIGIVFAFMSITGFTPSVARAGIMTLILLLGNILRRTPDSLNSLGFAALILCVVNPFAAADLGMLLSFFATLGLIVLTKPLTVFIVSGLKKIRVSRSTANLLAKAVVPTLAVTAFTFPIHVLYFDELSTISPLGNLLAVLPSGFLLLFGALAAIFYYIPFLSFLTNGLALLAGVLANYEIECALFLSKIPFSSVAVSYGHIQLWLSATFGLFAFALLIRKQARLLRMSALLSVILLLVSTLSFQLANNSTVNVAIIRSGEGCTVAVTENGRSIVVGSGGKYSATELAGYLSSYSPDGIGLLVLPDMEDSSAYSAFDVIKATSPEQVLIPNTDSIFANRLGQVVTPPGQLSTFGSSISFTFGEDVRGEILRLEDKPWIFLTASNVTFLICPNGGNVSLLPEEYRTPDFFIFTLLPDNLELLQCGVFVSSNTDLRLEKQLAKLAIDMPQIFETDINGTITVKINSGRRIAITAS